MGKVILNFLLFANLAVAQNPIKIANTYTEEKNNIIFKEIIFISTKHQKLHHIIDDEIIKTYTISTSKKGTGNIKNSEKTPLGLHVIKEKHGSETPLNGKMIGRVFYGEIAKIYNDNTRSKTDDITSRILWLSGEEEGYNKGGDVDSYQRYIYIHGTSEEGLLGIASSHGCIRMKNTEVIELFNKIDIGTKVLILDK